MRLGKARRAPLSKSVLVPGFLCVGLVLALGSMAGTSGARTPAGSAGRGTFVYEAVHALIIIKDKATYGYSATKWEGFGRLEQKLKRGPTELPILLGPGGAYPVNIEDHETSNGDETQTTSGVLDPCSGDWTGPSEDGSISLQVKQAGPGKLRTTWALPTGFASPKCGRPYDQFGGGIEVHATVDGNIGDRHLVLNINDKKTETSKDRSTQQTVSWDGRVVIDRK
jgi:hypothetical protein